MKYQMTIFRNSMDSLVIMKSKGSQILSLNCQIGIVKIDINSIIVSFCQKLAKKEKGVPME